MDRLASRCAIAKKPETGRIRLTLAIDSPVLTTPYLDALNSAQRRAVTHGVGSDLASPLLVIAGAGKTNTLAHSVAHLIVTGADPRRILLMTFLRRATAEMTRRVERIAR